MERGLTYTKEVTMVTEICCACGIAFGMPSDLQEHLKNDPNKYFHCPNGHSQHYSKSQQQRLREEAEKKALALEAELKKKREQLADSDAIKAIMQKQLDRATNKLKRVHNGVCPCCNRNFENLRRHIETKHPELIGKKAAGCSAKKH